MNFRCGRLIVALWIGVGLCGCQVSTAPKTVAQYTPGDRPRMQDARHAGQYELFSVAGARAAARPAAGSEPLLSVHLAKGQRFGFAKSESGVSAVAGEQSLAIGSQSHLWQLRADPGQRDWMTPAGGGAAVVIIATMIGVGVAAALVF